MSDRAPREGGTPWVDGAGPMDASIVLIGRDPGENEEKQGEPFVGRAGQELRDRVAEAGLDWNKFRRTNVMRRRSPNNRKPTPEEMDAYMPYLIEELESMPHARTLVVLGNEAMVAILGKSGITDKRGEEVAVSLGAKVFTAVPTFHPSYTMRKQSARPMLVKDLVRADRLDRGEPMLDPGNARFIGPVPEFTGRVSVDVETDENDKVRLVGVGEQPHEVYIMPTAAAIVEMSRMDPDEWLGHNLPSDRLWLRRAGLNLNPMKIGDTLLKAHLLNENRPLGLKKLALELLDPELYWRFIEVKLRKASTRGTIPFEQLGEYCADDVAATLLIDDVLEPQLNAKPALRALYDHMSLPLSNVLVEMMWNGIQFDNKKAEQVELAFAAERHIVEDQLNKVAGYTINWNSHPQVEHWLYDVLGIKPLKMTSTGRRSTDKEVLMKLKDAHPAVSLYMDRQKYEKKEEIIRSWLKRQHSDGRVYPWINQTGTVTGRLSGKDPNPQNVPTDERIRQLIIARPGYQIVSADYKTLEIGVGGWIFGADDLLAAYKTGDVHTVTATALLGRYPKDKHERKAFGKTPNFGLEYQQGDEGYRDYCWKQGLPLTLAEAAAQRAKWHALYPGVRAGWRRIGQAMKANGGTVVAPSGRERHLPEFLAEGNKSLVNEAWRQGCNFPVQCTAAEITHMAAIIAEPHMRGLGALMILHVHDQIAFEVPIQYVSDAAKLLKGVMELRVPDEFKKRFGVDIPIPLFVEVASGPDWGHLTEEP